MVAAKNRTTAKPRANLTKGLRIEIKPNVEEVVITFSKKELETAIRNAVDRRGSYEIDNAINGLIGKAMRQYIKENHSEIEARAVAAVKRRTSGDMKGRVSVHASVNY